MIDQKRGLVLSDASASLLAAVAAALIVLAASTGVMAQTSGTWTNTAGGLWSVPGNWSGGSVAGGSGASANFATLDISGTTTVNLDTPVTVGSLVFGDTTTSSLAGWVVANNGSPSSTLTLAGGSTPTIGVNNMSGNDSGAGTPSGTNGPGAVISAGIAGSQGLTVNRGSGSQVGFLTLSGSNTYTGTTTVSGTSVLVLGSADALGGSTSVSILSGGGLRIANGVTIGQGKTISNASGGINFEGGLSVAQGTGTWAGGYSGGRVGYMSGTLVLSGSASGNLEVSGYGGDTATVPNLQHGVVLTGGSHAITSLNIVRGVVKLGSTNALTTTATLDVRSANASNSTAFDLNGFDQQVAGLTTSNTGTNATAFLTNSAATFNTLTVNQAGNTTVLAIIQGNLNLTKTGAGNLTLSPRFTPGGATSDGSNTFAGVTRVDGGTLTVGNATALFGSTVDTDGAGTLSTGTLAAATFGALTGSNGFSLTRNSAPFTLSLGGNNVSSTYAATLSGSGGLTKVGTGTLALSGTNTYSGTTTVSVGTLRIASTAALPGFSTIGRYSVADGATLLVDDAIDNATVATMLATGNFLTNSRIGFDTSGGNRTYSNPITGTVGVVKVGGNTLSLTGSNTLGAIRVMGGTLAFQATANLAGSGQVILNNGTLQFNGGSASGTLSGRATVLEGPGRIQADGDQFTLAAIQGAGQLTLGPGSALFVQNSAGTYTGGTVIEAGARIAVGNNGAFGTGSIRFEGGGLRSTQGSARTLANNVTLAGNVTFLASDPNLDRNVTFTGPVTIAGASRTVTVSTSPAPGETGIFFTGSIGDGGANLGFTKAGPGTLVLGGSNSYGGTTTVSAGRLRIDSATALPGLATVGRWSVASGASLVVPNAIGDTTIDSLLATGNFTPGSQLGFDTSAGSRGYAWSNPGNAGLLKLGGNTLTLTGSAAANAPVTIAAGTVVADSAAALPAVGAVTFSGGGLRYSTSYAADLSGRIAGSSGAIAIDTAGRTIAFAGNIAATNSGGLTKTGSGTLTLSGTNAYVGTTTVTGGTLAFTTSAAFAGVTGTIALDGGGLVSAGEGGPRSTSQAISLGAGGGTIANSAVDLWFADGVISGTGPLTIAAGAGELVLRGENTNSGGVTLEPGSRFVVIPNSIGPAGAPTSGAFGTGTLTLAGGSLRPTTTGDRTVGNAVSVTADTTFSSAGLNDDKSLTFTGPVTLAGTSRTFTVNTAGPGTPAVIFSGAIGDGGNAFGFTKAGPGRMILTGTSGYTGATTVSTGRLAVDGSIAASSGVSVSAGAELGGSGVVAALAGAGLVAPGNSPGILTSPAATLSDGLDFAFEFTQAGAPTWSSAAASGNDVLRLTDLTTPLVGTATGTNVFNIYFLETNQTYLGGLFTDRTDPFESLITADTFNYFVRDAGGAVTYEGFTYSSLSTGSVTRSTVQVSSADFAGGTVSGGHTMQFVVVPEPSAWLLAGLGLAACGWAARRRFGPRRA